MITNHDLTIIITWCFKEFSKYNANPQCSYSMCLIIAGKEDSVLA